MRIVFVLRHPCAVASSKVKLGWRLNLREAFLRQDTLVTDYLTHFMKEITNARSEFEQHIIAWCIENFVPLQQLNKGDVCLAFYENLCADPKAELQKLFAYLEKPFNDSILSLLAKPSVTSRTVGDVSAVVAGKSVLDGWRTHVSSDELAFSQRMTGLFGLDQIYGNQTLANAENAESLFRGAPVPIG
jgi:hypothetical protein